MTRDSKARPKRVQRRLPFRHFAGNSDGSTAIEFSLLAIPFLMILFAILETGISLAAQQSLVNATDDVARRIRTGDLKTVSQSELHDLICDRLKWVASSDCTGLQVDLRSYGSFQAAATQNVYLLPGKVALELDNGGAGKPLKSEIGGSKAKQTLRAYYFWPLITKLLISSMSTAGTGKTLLSASQTWQNEAY